MAKSSIRAELVALADYAMTAEDKKLSVIGIFDKLFVRSFPSSHARMSFVVTFVGEAGKEEKLKLKIVSPADKEDFNADVNINFGDNGRFNFISNFEGFPFNEAGTYRFIFELDGKEIVSYGLDVILVKEEGATAAKAN
ncbi:hypothetical protein KBD71_03700 [Candidatus Woesebacteria bacterium]|nr:hypothetical protein [Candidatus Woesebacteria bacterium]